MGDAWAHGGEEGRGKLRKAGGRRTQPVSPGWPNGETRRAGTLVITARAVKRTQGTETSQYLEEEEAIAMPLVAASERGPCPNRSPCGIGVVGPTDAVSEASRSPLERGPRDGERPVGEGEGLIVVEFLSNARHE